MEFKNKFERSQVQFKKKNVHLKENLGKIQINYMELEKIQNSF